MNKNYHNFIFSSIDFSNANQAKHFIYKKNTFDRIPNKLEEKLIQPNTIRTCMRSVDRATMNMVEIQKQKLIFRFSFLPILSERRISYFSLSD